MTLGMEIETGPADTVKFDVVAALTNEVARLEAENARLAEENGALRGELDAANDGVLELLRDLDAARDGDVTDGGGR